MSKFNIRRPLFIACACLAGLLLASGQANGAPASTAPPAAKDAPSPIALGEVVSRAQSDTAILRDEQAGLNSAQSARVVDEELPALTQQINERLAEDYRMLDTNPSLSRLQSSQDSWQSISDHLSSLQGALSDRAAQLDAQSAQLDQLNQTWQATLEAGKKSGAPAAVTQQISAVVALIANLKTALRTEQAQIYSRQALVAAQDGRMKAGKEVVAKAIETARSQLFERDHPPLWDAQAASQAAADNAGSEGASIQAQFVTLKNILRDKLPQVLVHVLLLALLVAGLYWVRNTIRSHAGGEEALRQAAQVFEAPLATALLLTLLATAWLYPHAPPILLAAAGATGLIPAVIIIRRLIDAANHPLLYATVVAYFVDQVRYAVAPPGILSRYLFIVELWALSLFLLTQFRSKPASDSTPARLERITRIYLRFTFPVLIVAGLANVFGYVHLSLLIGNGMLNSSYLAIIFYAAVRIVDALAAGALRVRPLAGLAMVRRHRGLLYVNIARTIRWLAVACWLLAALRLFSLRDPVWDEINRLLDTTLPWFSIKVPLRNVLAFPITIWVAFLLSRFIRFTLEEEVYPHLQLNRGIPYAASTMVHYTILLLGFFAAVAATGAQLTQFAFLAGAFGVGLGFGLQNIMNNFVSGVILLFERPIKVGDILQIDANIGKVERIGIRASVILLTNGAELIVPNGNLISNPVTNWTLSSNERLIEIPVNVAPGVDSQLVLKLLTDVVKADPRVLKTPAPQALLASFGAAALTFRVRAWTDSEEEWMTVTSDLSLAIHSALASKNIAMS